MFKAIINIVNMIEDDLYCHLDTVGFVRVSRNNITGELLPFSNLKGPLIDKYSGYNLIRKDLQLLKQCLEEWKAFNKSSSLIIKQSVTSFFIITYGKLFAQADGRKIKLESNNFSKIFTENELKIHKELMTLRNNYIAHGGETIFERSPVLVSKMSHNNETILNIYSSPTYMNNLKINNEEYFALILKISSFVEQKLNKYYSELKTFVESTWNESEFDKHAIIPELEDVFTLAELNARQT